MSEETILALVLLFPLAPMYESVTALLFVFYFLRNWPFFFSSSGIRRELLNASTFCWEPRRSASTLAFAASGSTSYPMKAAALMPLLPSSMGFESSELLRLLMLMRFDLALLSEVRTDDPGVAFRGSVEANFYGGGTDKTLSLRVESVVLPLLVCW